jgi:hypothetical protein
MVNHKTVFVLMFAITAAVSLAVAPSLLNSVSADPKEKCTGPGKSCDSQGAAQDKNPKIESCHSNSPNSANHKCVGN